MAKSKTKPRVSKDPQPPKGVTPSYENRVPTYYANYANITSNLREIFIDFCLVAPPLMIDPESQLLQAPVIARIITTPEFAQALRDTIDTHLKKQDEERKQG